MTITPEVEKEIGRIDDNINSTQTAINSTEETITRLVKLNEGRKQYLRKLGQKRSELLTFELL